MHFPKTKRYFYYKIATSTTQPVTQHQVYYHRLNVVHFVVTVCAGIGRALPVLAVVANAAFLSITNVHPCILPNLFEGGKVRSTVSGAV